MSSDMCRSAHEARIVAVCIAMVENSRAGTLESVPGIFRDDLVVSAQKLSHYLEPRDCLVICYEINVRQL